MTRYFRTNDETLETVRAMLDQAWGYPNEGTKTVSSLPAASDCLHDEQGRAYLAVDDAYCEYILPSQILPTLLESGNVEEVGEADYQAHVPPV